MYICRYRNYIFIFFLFYIILIYFEIDNKSSFKGIIISKKEKRILICSYLEFVILIWKNKGKLRINLANKKNLANK